MDLQYKDNVILVKAIADLTTTLYNSNKHIVLNNIIKEGNYQSEYGQFYTRVSEAKTIKDIIAKKQEEINKLQEEINQLKTQDQNSIYTLKNIVLNSKHTEIADNIAKDLLKEIINNIDSKTIANKYAKL